MYHTAACRALWSVVVIPPVRLLLLFGVAFSQYQSIYIWNGLAGRSRRELHGSSREPAKTMDGADGLLSGSAQRPRGDTTVGNKAAYPEDNVGRTVESKEEEEEEEEAVL